MRILKCGRVDLGHVHPISSEITSQQVYAQRRQWLALGAGALASSVLPLARAADAGAVSRPGKRAPLPAPRTTEAGAWAMDKPTSYADATGYNNFYEFGTDKSDPAQRAQGLRTRPWTVTIEGAVRKPVTLDLDQLLKLAPLEERIYRLRCVEGWSMVLPWVGYPLAEVLRRAEPLGSAKYVQFISLADPQQMPGLDPRVLAWPYAEGLRLDEAMHPLTLVALGLYGEVLPPQNGAPVRIVVPWKYGFKSAKSIVRIRLTEQMPPTAWNRAAPQEYGFFANVNPAVDHPRWSQAAERRIGEDGLFSRKRPTQPFNGYGAQVAGLYTGMDLRRWF